MEEKKFCVAFFDNYVSTVPLAWVDQSRKIVHYPKKPFSIKNIDSMDIEEDWFKYNLKKIIQPFTYEDAKLLEKACEKVDTSEDTDAIVQRILNNKRGKRVPKKKKLDETESDTDIDEFKESQGKATKKTKSFFNESALKTFTSIKNSTTIKNQNTSFDEDGILNEEDNNDSDNIIKNVSLSNKNAESQIDSCIIDNTMAMQSNSYEENERCIKNQFTTSKGILQSIDKDGEDFPTSSENNLTMSAELNRTQINSQSKKPYIKNVQKVSIPLRIQNNVGSNQQNCTCSCHKNNMPGALTEAKYKIYHEQLLRKLNRIGSEFHRDVENNENENSLLPSFPLNTILQMKDLDSLLDSSSDARKQFVKKIKKIGGNSEGDCIRNALRTVMTYELGKVYSWSGQRHTESFKRTKMCEILKETIAAKHKSYEIATCEKYIRSWLQHANERC